MRLVVDLTKCQGYAQCAFLAPDVFSMQGDEALMYNPNPDDVQRRRVLRAAAACPVQAILLDQLEGPAPSAQPAETSTEAPVNGGAFKQTGRIVIVGASLTGLRAAERLREEGFTGSLTLVGDEKAEPYDRPPLSKQVQAGWVDAHHTALPRRRKIDADWRLGVPAAGLDLAAARSGWRTGQRSRSTSSSSPPDCGPDSGRFPPRLRCTVC